MIYSFTWNGINCRTKGIRLQAMPEIIRPEERVNHVMIPGRAGELTQTEGEDIYNSYIQTIPMAVYSEASVRAVENWLRGDGYVTFSGQPTLKQKARVINAVTFTKHGRNSNYWNGEVQFYCESGRPEGLPEDRHHRKRRGHRGRRRTDADHPGVCQRLDHRLRERMDSAGKYAADRRMQRRLPDPERRVKRGDLHRGHKADHRAGVEILIKR